MFLPTASLPDNELDRQERLSQYFGERVVECVREDGGWHVTLGVYPDVEYYVDPELNKGLSWWGEQLTIAGIPYARRDMRGWFLSLNDAWGLFAWSRWLQAKSIPSEAIILHIDDHDDLMSPRIGITEGGYVDLCTTDVVDLIEPASVARAIESGAIGQGSFLVPLLDAVPTVHVFHLCATLYSSSRSSYHKLVKGSTRDDLLDPTLLRPTVRVEDGPALIGASSYHVSSDPAGLVEAMPSNVPIFMHLDMDYFNNRFNGDSDYESNTTRHDPSLAEIHLMIDGLVKALETVRPRLTAPVVGISPGFFPGELWKPAMDHVGSALDELHGGVPVVARARRGQRPTPKPRVRSVHGDRVDSADVTLRKGAGSSNRGGSAGGAYWHIEVDGVRAGYIFINVVDDERLGLHPSIQIHLNTAMRGRGIGQIAYGLASEASQYNTIYAHMRKSNTASKVAAQHAGYEVSGLAADTQLTMMWRRR